MTGRTASHDSFLTGDHRIVLLPARVARILMRQGGLEQFHAQRRGLDPELDAALLAMKVAGATWHTTHARSAPPASVTETAPRKPAEAAQPSMWMTTQEAADALDVTDSRIRQRCRTGELDAKQDGRTWRVSRDSVNRARTRRALARDTT